MLLKLVPILLLLSLACSSSEQANNGTTRFSDTLRGVDPARFSGEAVRSDTSSAVITLERTACFGACPMYVLALYEDGTVVFNGLRFVQEEGLRIRNIGAEKIQDLVGHARRISYTSMDDRYEGSATDPSPTDLPSAITSVRIGGNTKSISDYWGAPATLREFERHIDELTGSDKWIGKPENGE